MATLEVFQDMMHRREDRVLKSIEGLSGGIGGSGSTCGIVTGGSLGLALMFDNVLQQQKISMQARLLYHIGEYVRWFEENFGSSLCRKRTGENFYTPSGQLRYFLPGDKVLKCIWHMRGAIQHLYTFKGKRLPEMDWKLKEIQGEPIHCAQTVLRGIRNRTGVGDPLIERLSLIFDGGLGLKGGICGALVGAIMGINFLLGMNIRNTKFFGIIKAFIVGQMNLILDKSIGDSDPYGIGKDIVQSFEEKAGALECHNITKKMFFDWADFQMHICSSNKCADLIEHVTTETSTAINKMA